MLSEERALPGPIPSKKRRGAGEENSLAQDGRNHAEDFPSSLLTPYHSGVEGEPKAEHVNPKGVREAGDQPHPNSRGSMATGAGGVLASLASLGGCR